jgi:hypothetical protein
VQAPVAPADDAFESAAEVNEVLVHTYASYSDDDTQHELVAAWHANLKY